VLPTPILSILVPHVVGSQGGLLVTSERIDISYPPPPPFFPGLSCVRGAHAFLNIVAPIARRKRKKKKECDWMSPPREPGILYETKRNELPRPRAGGGGGGGGGRGNYRNEVTVLYNKQ
jgi:hypothetical protein